MPTLEAQEREKQTSTCEKCGDPTWQGAHLCVDCKRKKPNVEPCNFPKCKETFVKKGKNLYCPEHKSMNPNQRARAIKDAQGL